MVSFPSISIHQQFAQLGIDADHATLEQKQPKATYEMKRVPPKLQIESPRGDLQIDQSKAWDALNRGGHLETMNRIYSEAKNVALQGIARIVEEGNRLGNIAAGGNPIADNAQQLFFERFEFNFVGPAAYDNVDIHYTAKKPRIEVTDGLVEVNVQVNRPELNVSRGKLDIYMLQYPKVEITPPQIDLKI
ncbi:hypothetical protein PN4B1_36170 [Paenibacillus naphthalenovorans]|uniref:DUF6470 family protein n=1 Tax=Paenibacillus naphthalenovorans TaxID=162209 RepID=UPI0010BABE6F|nr:DUF6470 family protein [Paenibacillus naphthalenovorans]GCL73676.1 hypothetical protein PN4B1_36170 [Paenibacillus naphthalenovorans]